jgi:hypothetical protein
VATRLAKDFARGIPGLTEAPLDFSLLPADNREARTALVAVVSDEFFGPTNGAYTLTAATGSYTLSGQAAALTVTRKLTADAGAFTLTGQAAGVAAGRRLTAETGSHTLSGQAAGLTVTRRLTADAGTFALTGQAAGLRPARVLTAATGAFALTGQAAALTYDPLTAYSLTAAAGAYSLTGQAATLTYSGASSGGGTTTTAAATTSTATTAQTSTTRTGNTLQPPPRLTGNVSQDVAILNSYVADLYRSLALEADIVGTQETTTNNVTTVTNQVTDLSTTVTQVGRTYDSRAAAEAAAAAGEIPAIVTAIRIEGWATRGDGGASVYVRVTSAPAHSLYFLDASGGFWELDEAEPHFAMAGILGDDLGADPTTDCTDGWNALYAYLEARGGGEARYGWRNYFFADHADLPERCGVRGPPGQGRDPKFTGLSTTIEALHYQPGLVFATNKSLRYTDACFVMGCTVRRAGIVVHTDMEGALDRQVAFNSILIAKWRAGDATGCTFAGNNLYGGEIGLDAVSCNSLVEGENYGDCTTLILARDSGETKKIKGSKRKPILTTNAAISPETISVVSIYDHMGFVGVEVAESLSAAGLTTGQRVASDNLPEPYPGVRLTVTLIDDNNFYFPDTTWDPSYATYDTSNSDFTFQPGGSSGLDSTTAPVYETAGGNIGVRTLIDMPFQVGHLAVFGAGSLPQSAFTHILTRVNARDFEINQPWPTDAGEEAALLALDDALFELAAMPNTRLHKVGTTAGERCQDITGSYLGYGVINSGGAGTYIEFASKGGGGLYLSDTATTVNGRVEGGTVGDLEMDAAGGIALHIANTRMTVLGSYKSNSTGLRAEFASRRHYVTTLGCEFVDNRTAAIWQSNGRGFYINSNTRGEGKTLLDGIDTFWAFGGDIQPEGASSLQALSADQYTDLERSHWDTLDQETLTSVHTVWRWRGWVSGVLTDYGTLSADGLALDVPLTAPNITAPIILTGSTSGTTAQALTLTGTAASGTSSGYTLDTSPTARALRIVVVAQRSNGTGAATNSESAVWDLNAIMSRGGSTGTTAVARTGGLGPLTPSHSYDATGTDSAAWTVTLTVSSEALVVNVAAGAGQNVNWKASITALDVT